MSFTDRLVLWLHVGFVIFAIGPVPGAIASTPRYIRRRDLPVLRYLSRITTAFTIASLGVLVMGIVLAQEGKDFSRPWLTASMTLYLVAVVLLVLIIRDQRKAIKALDGSVAVAAGPATATAAGPPPPAPGRAAGGGGGAGGGATGARAGAGAGAAAPPTAPAAAPAAATAAGAAGSGAPVGAAGSGAPVGAAAAGIADPSPAADRAQQTAAQGAGAGPGPGTAAPAAAAQVATVERGRIAMLGGVVNLIWLIILVLMIWNA